MANQHITKRANGWAVQPVGGKRASSIQPTQQKAIEVGRNIARNQKSELIVHDRHGRIRTRDSFGNDPFPPKG